MTADLIHRCIKHPAHTRHTGYQLDRCRCPDCTAAQADYTREWGRDRRDFLTAHKAESGCVECGYRDNVAALVFHHRDPQDKLYAITPSTGMARLLEEIAKCDILCANCHAIHHAEQQ